MNMQNIASNHQNNNQQNNQNAPVKIYDNKELAIKGRFVMVVSFLTIVHSLGYIKLDKLPFIGGSVKDATPNNITAILISVLFYALYRYWVYKRIAELDSSAYKLSKEIRDSILLKRYKKIFERAYAYLLENGNLVDFEYKIITPDQSYNDTNHPDERGYISPYNIAYWKVSTITLKDPDPKTLYLSPSGNRAVRVTVGAGYGYILKDGSSSQTSGHYVFDIPFTEYLQLKKKSDFLAHIYLPDFLEKVAPYIAGTAAFTIGVYTLIF